MELFLENGHLTDEALHASLPYETDVVHQGGKQTLPSHSFQILQ